MLELLMGFGIKGGGSVPGPSELIAGTYEQGYYGEVPASEFIDGVTLASEIGLTVGTSFNSDAGWLKFSLDYKTLYVAKRPFRYNLDSLSISSVGASLGTVPITINGKQYKVRLLKGRGDGLSTSFAAGYDILPSHNSEWNRLMYHVSASPNNGTITSEGISVGDWAQFSNTELGVNEGNGGLTLCQDVTGTTVISRGKMAVSYIWRISNGNLTLNNGWRPVLELME